jgi:hypothetical protein
MRNFLLFLFLIGLGLLTFGVEGTALTLYICLMVEIIQKFKEKK